MICTRCGKEIPITCEKLAYISMEGNPYSYMPICDECNKAFINFIDNAPTVEYPEQITIKCDTEEDKQKLLSAFRNAKLNAIVEEERPQWIPVSERLPDNEIEVLFQYKYGQSMMVGYHIHDSTIYPFEYEDENETGWYDSEDNFICGDDEVIAWMSKPEPYKEAENVKPCSSCAHFNNGNRKSYPCGSCFINSHNMWEAEK